jgi:Tol biopolymer transport system component
MSPSGKVIAFISNRSGRWQVWRIDSDGDFPKQLTDVPNDAENPKFSPDGKWIFYEAWLPTGWTLWKIPVDGGNPIQLTFKDARTWAISPDGKELAYTFHDELKKHNVVAFKSTAGGEPHRFYEFPRAEEYSITQWNQEGIFCSDKAGTGIFILPAQGGPLKPVAEFEAGERINFSVSPDGGQIVFARINSSTSALLITESK